MTCRAIHEHYLALYHISQKQIVGIRAKKLLQACIIHVFSRSTEASNGEWS